MTSPSSQRARLSVAPMVGSRTPAQLVDQPNPPLPSPSKNSQKNSMPEVSHLAKSSKGKTAATNHTLGGGAGAANASGGLNTSKRRRCQRCKGPGRQCQNDAAPGDVYCSYHRAERQRHSTSQHGAPPAKPRYPAPAKGEYGVGKRAPKRPRHEAAGNTPPPLPAAEGKKARTAKKVIDEAKKQRTAQTAAVTAAAQANMMEEKHIATIRGEAILKLILVEHFKKTGCSAAELQEKVQHMLESPFLTKDALAWIANVFDYDFQDFRKTAPRVIKVFGL
uniref:WRC domain-containing protein n=1 Tax=Pycnococcus provasolii TaxID=41880 RepID=A0A7S2AGB7_9CHLO|mmetsp:Transcript_10352/g.23407  ORF Transcript_10352/g.23407 Transcript_10352/m.23407 type:complete len:278 (+) Transcript_10352:57-890(+)